VELRLLGEIEARVGGRVVDLGPRQQRLVLAALALDANRLVSLETLIDLLWPVSPTRTAAHAVQVCVSKLRSVLTGSGAELVTKGSAYLLRVEPTHVDAHRFQALVAQARAATDDEQLVALLDQALALWRGPALADVTDADSRDRLCGGLAEMRLVAVEDRLEALLRLGRHQDVVGELTEWVATHPARERFVGQLTLALYRGGQASEALRVTRRHRDYLAGHLGLDPGDDLRRLELAILRNDPALNAPIARARPVLTAAVPAQLPLNVTGFTGRAATIAQLDALRARPGNAIVLTAIAGTAGVGKTALAVHWAHRVRDAFPSGQLYINLCGYAPNPPLRPEQVLSEFLRALGVPGENIPAELTEAAALYRSLLADKHMLVVLDNANCAEQVRPLLPAGPDCLVLVTSRNRLDGLVAMDGATRITLDVLPLAEAVALVDAVLGGGRVGAEPDAAAELARICACLPLALRIAAARLSGFPRQRIADYVADLHAADPLISLQIDEDPQGAVRVAFGLSYDALEPRTRRLFRLWGLVPGPDISTAAVAALADEPVDAAARMLAQLTATHLLEHDVPGRYTGHDLLRRYATDRSHDEDGEPDRAAAIERLLNHYLQGTTAAADKLYPQVIRLPTDPSTTVFTDHTDALAWLDREHLNLVAAVQFAHHDGQPRIACQLADALRGYFILRRHAADWFTVAGIALTAAGHDPMATAAAEMNLGAAHDCFGQYPQAIEHFTAAVELSRQTGWQRAEAAMLMNLGLIDENLGDWQRATERYTTALDLSRQHSEPVVESTGLLNLATVNLFRGDFASAVDQSQQALNVCVELGLRNHEGFALDRLGLAAHLQGRCDDAIDYFARALPIMREVGARSDEALAHAHLADVLRDVGQHSRARMNADAAVELAIAIGDPSVEAHARNAAAAVDNARGAHHESVEQHEHALRLARTAGVRQAECQALTGLADSHFATGHREQATAYAEHALALARDIGHQPLTARASTVLALVRREQPNDEAATHGRPVRAATLAATVPTATVPTAVGSPPVRRVTCTRYGRRWRVEWGTNAVILDQSVGMLHLAVLIANPGVEIAAIDLVAGLDVVARAVNSGGPPVQPVLDHTTIQRYRQRITELREEIDRLESAGDDDRAAATRKERDWVLAELGVSTGLGGRRRAFIDDQERARVAVGKAIRRTLTRIERADAVVGAQLRAAIHTGNRCWYRPV
jgi:DNA-binding SARP family transcriptional activator